MADINTVAEISQGVGKRLAETDAGQLFGSGARGNLGKEAQNNFSEAVQLIRALLGPHVSLEAIPSNVATDLADALRNMLEVKHLVESFTTEGDDWHARRDAIAKDIAAAYSALFRVGTPILGAALTTNQGLAGITNQANTILARIHTVNQQAMAAIAEVDRTLAVARGAALEGGVGAQAKYFRDLTNENRKEAWWWFRGLAAFGIVSSAFVVYLLFGDFPDYEKSPHNFWAHAVARLVAFSVLVFFLTWTSRNYRAARHNQAMNQHRQTALETFQAFVLSADTEMRNQVLIETTKTIFAPHVSGYLTNEPDPFPQTTIVEMVRAASGNKG